MGGGLARFAKDTGVVTKGDILGSVTFSEYPCKSKAGQGGGRDICTWFRRVLEYLALA